MMRETKKRDEEKWLIKWTQKREMGDVCAWVRAGTRWSEDRETEGEGESSDKMSRSVSVKRIQSIYVHNGGDGNRCDGIEARDGQIITINYSQHAAILFACITLVPDVCAVRRHTIARYYRTYNTIIPLSHH